MFRSFPSLVRAPRPIDRNSVLGAVLYALQAVVCTWIVIYIYQRFQLGRAMWAVVSAVLVLQPGLEQSYGASATRFVSNLIGALTGAVVDKLHGHGAADVMAALALVVGFCEVLRLDQGLRSACASVAIVMMSVGCSTALAVRVVAGRIETFLHPGTTRRSGSTQVDEG
jgi:uncharacterized membrane protein YgaE (UPF0421/DUF939 family)